MAGRSHQPTDALRRQVQSLASFGTPQDDISRLLGITKKTLAKHYRAELDLAEMKANAMVADSLFKQAVGSPAEYDTQGRLVRAEQGRVLSAAIFWAKTRMKWRETIEPPADGENELVVRIVRGGLPPKKGGGTDGGGTPVPAPA